MAAFAGEKGALNNLLKRKREVKKAFCKQLSINATRPLLGVVLDKELANSDAERLKRILEGIAHIDINVVILTDSNVFDAPKVKHIEYGRKNRHEMLEAADMSLSFSFSDVQEMLLHGTIPISSMRPEVSDYNPNKETGNGFIYKEEDHWCVFAALVRALETYKFPYDWNNIVRQGLASVLV